MSVLILICNRNAYETRIVESDQHPSTHNIHHIRMEIVKGNRVPNQMHAIRVVMTIFFIFFSLSLYFALFSSVLSGLA